MQNFNIKKSTYSLNYLSILGFIYFFIHIFFIFVIKPYIIKMPHLGIDNYEELLTINEMYIIYIFGVIIGIEIILTTLGIISIFIEQILYNKNILNNTAKPLNKPLRLGLWLHLTPILHIIIFMLFIILL